MSTETEKVIKIVEGNIPIKNTKETISLHMKWVNGEIEYLNINRKFGGGNRIAYFSSPKYLDSAVNTLTIDAVLNALKTAISKIEKELEIPSKDAKNIVTSGNVLTTSCSHCIATFDHYHRYIPPIENSYPLVCNSILSSKFRKNVYSDFLCEHFYSREVYWGIAPRIIEDFNKFKVEE